MVERVSKILLVRNSRIPAACGQYGSRRRQHSYLNGLGNPLHRSPCGIGLPCKSETKADPPKHQLTNRANQPSDCVTLALLPFRTTVTEAPVTLVCVTATMTCNGTNPVMLSPWPPPRAERITLERPHTESDRRRNCQAAGGARPAR